MKKISDEEIEKACDIGILGSGWWILGAKWCREKMEESEYESALKEQILRLLIHKMYYGEKILLWTDENVQDYITRVVDLEVARNKNAMNEMPKDIITHDEKVQEGKVDTHWTTKGRYGDMYGKDDKDEEPFRQKQEGEKEQAAEEELDSMLGAVRKANAEKSDLKLRLLAVQKTNSLEEARELLRWLKGEGV